MAYITYEEYIALYGPGISEEDFPRYETLASSVIDGVTKYEIRRRGFPSLPDLTQDLIRQAAAAQISYFDQLGGPEVVMSGQTGQAFTVGKVSVQALQRANAATSGVASGLVAPAVWMYLEQTGLMNPSVPVSGWPRPWLWGGW